MEMNILLTSAGRRTYLVDYFREALKKAGLKGKVYAANSQESPALAAADGKVITPLIYSREYIPFLLAVSVAIATKVAKKSLLLPVLSAVPALAVPVYLTASVITGLWHPLWIIILAGVLVDIVILIVFLNRKISLKEKALKEGNLPEDEGDLSEWENR